MINIGDYVQIIDTNFKGALYKLLDNGKCIVKVNNKNIITNLSKLKKIEKENEIKEKDNKVKITFTRYTDNNEFIPEIMIRHQVLEEAIFNLDMFLNDAINRNAKTIKIIHGRHGGILRNAVKEYLKTNPYVLNYRLGNYFEGGIGVTIANLK